MVLLHVPMFHFDGNTLKKKKKICFFSATHTLITILSFPLTSLSSPHPHLTQPPNWKWSLGLPLLPDGRTRPLHNGQQTWQLCAHNYSCLPFLRTKEKPQNLLGNTIVLPLFSSGESEFVQYVGILFSDYIWIFLEPNIVYRTSHLTNSGFDLSKISFFKTTNLFSKNFQGLFCKW